MPGAPVAERDGESEPSSPLGLEEQGAEGAASGSGHLSHLQSAGFELTAERDRSRGTSRPGKERERRRPPQGRGARRGGRAGRGGGGRPEGGAAQTARLTEQAPSRGARSPGSRAGRASSFLQSRCPEWSQTAIPAPRLGAGGQWGPRPPQEVRHSGCDGWQGRRHAGEVSSPPPAVPPGSVVTALTLWLD